MDRIALGAEAEKQATALVAAKTEPQAPQLPANLEKCLRASLRAKKLAKTVSNQNAAKAAEKANPKPTSEVAQDQSPSADKLVLAKLDAEKRRQACAAALLAWHEKQKVAAVKK